MKGVIIKTHFVCLCFVIAFTVGACTKGQPQLSHSHGLNNSDESKAVSRKIQFSLYTDKDFSGDDHQITFTVTMRNEANHLLWDSILPAMRIKDIPKLADKIFIEKAVPDSDSSILRVGFNYTIENIGMSWYTDTCHKTTSIKKVDYNFQ